MVYLNYNPDRDLALTVLNWFNILGLKYKIRFDAETISPLKLILKTFLFIRKI
jgi:hypothetical protein